MAPRLITRGALLPLFISCLSVYWLQTVGRKPQLLHKHLLKDLGVEEWLGVRRLSIIQSGATGQLARQMDSWHSSSPGKEASVGLPPALASHKATREWNPAFWVPSLPHLLPPPSQDPQTSGTEKLSPSLPIPQVTLVLRKGPHSCGTSDSFYVFFV